MAQEGITFDYHNIRNASSLEKAVKGKRYPPKMVFDICSVRPEECSRPAAVAIKQVHFGINGADVKMHMNSQVYISQAVNPGYWWCILHVVCTHVYALCTVHLL